MAARTAIISITVGILVLAALGVGVYLARRQERIQARAKGLSLKGDLNRDEEKALMIMLDQAAKILRNLGRNDPSNYMDPEVLRADTRIDVGRWLTRYDNTKEKVSK